MLRKARSEFREAFRGTPLSRGRVSRGRAPSNPSVKSTSAAGPLVVIPLPGAGSSLYFTPATYHGRATRREEHPYCLLNAGEDRFLGHRNYRKWLQCEELASVDACGRRSRGGQQPHINTYKSRSPSVVMFLAGC
ncbi:hypothetical protein LSAT2_032059 [Lamellibrachia satsuma]|nr:hypothetical protein LSAT2_032059 [Lamellibrachia satsuma]